MSFTRCQQKASTDWHGLLRSRWNVKQLYEIFIFLFSLHFSPKTFLHMNEKSDEIMRNEGGLIWAVFTAKPERRQGWNGNSSIYVTQTFHEVNPTFRLQRVRSEWTSSDYQDLSKLDVGRIDMVGFGKFWHPVALSVMSSSSFSHRTSCLLWTFLRCFDLILYSTRYQLLSQSAMVSVPNIHILSAILSPNWATGSKDYLLIYYRLERTHTFHSAFVYSNTKYWYWWCVITDLSYDLLLPVQLFAWWTHTNIYIITQQIYFYVTDCLFLYYNNSKPSFAICLKIVNQKRIRQLTSIVCEFFPREFPNRTFSSSDGIVKLRDLPRSGTDIAVYILNISMSLRILRKNRRISSRLSPKKIRPTTFISHKITYLIVAFKYLICLCNSYINVSRKLNPHRKSNNTQHEDMGTEIFKKEPG